VPTAVTFKEGLCRSKSLLTRFPRHTKGSRQTCHRHPRTDQVRQLEIQQLGHIEDGKNRGEGPEIIDDAVFQTQCDRSFDGFLQLGDTVPPGGQFTLPVNNPVA